MKGPHNPPGMPEPIPDWHEGRVVWEWALPVHSNIFGAIFAGIAVYAVYILVKLLREPSRKSLNYFICITVLVCIFGLTRAIVLFADPYTTGRPTKLSPGYGLILFSLGYPCLTSGFFLINWSLVEVTKLQLLPLHISKRKVLALVLTAHFIVVITFDTVFVYFQAYILLFICRSFFVLWGFFLFGGFVIAAARIQRQVKKTLRTISQFATTTTTNMQNPNTDAGNGIGNAITIVTIVTPMSDQTRIEQARTRKVIKVAGRAGATGLLICCTQIYALWEFYVYHNNGVVPKAWPWWTYQTCFRLIELFMVTQMFLIVRPKK